MLPGCFCWTRYGTEAGEPIEAILARKERERAANGGVFLWGIGNALGPSMRVLLDRTSSPRVAFSPMRSKPRLEDVRPESLVQWGFGETMDGEAYSLPQHSVVKSRAGTSGVSRSHYALVCHSDLPLRVSENAPEVRFGSLRNLLSGRRLGASQVTAIVEVDHAGTARGAAYSVPFTAALVAPYFIRLTAPYEIAA